MTHLVIGEKGWANWQHTVIQIGAKLALFAVLLKAAPQITGLPFISICVLLCVIEVSNYQQGSNRAKARWEQAMLDNDDARIMLHIHESRVNKDE